MVHYSERMIIVGSADLSEICSSIFVGNMCVFVSRPMENATFLRKSGEPAKRVVYFLRERDTFR